MSVIEIKWIDNKKRKPTKGDEYLVVWNLKDGDYPVVSSMDWDSYDKKWTDPRSNNLERDEEILMWASMPKAPKGINKSIWSVE